MSLGVLTLIVYILAGAAILAYTRGFLSREIIPDIPTEGIVLSYGLDRDATTRAFSVEMQDNVAAPDQIADFTVRLAGDLRREEGPGELPESQIAVGVNRVTNTRLSITITANPWSPERVEPGLFTGTVQVRGQGVSEDVAISVWLQDRDGRWAAFGLTLLLAGATLGLLVKYITERLTPQAGLVRRLANLKRALGYRDDGATLPVGVRMRIDDLEDQISRADYASVERAFECFDKDKARLATISRQFAILLDLLDQQAGELDTAEHLSTTERRLIEGVIETEFRDVQMAQTLEWPQHEEALTARCMQSRGQFAAAGVVISRFIENPSNRNLRRQLFDFQLGYLPSPSSGIAELDFGGPGFPESDGSTSAASRMGPSHRARRDLFGVVTPGLRQDPGRISFLFRQARTIAAFSSVVVVSLVGLKLQYWTISLSPEASRTGSGWGFGRWLLS